MLTANEDETTMPGVGKNLEERGADRPRHGNLACEDRLVVTLIAADRAVTEMLATHDQADLEGFCNCDLCSDVRGGGWTINTLLNLLQGVLIPNKLWVNWNIQTTRVGLLDEMRRLLGDDKADAMARELDQDDDADQPVMVEGRP